MEIAPLIFVISMRISGEDTQAMKYNERVRKIMFDKNFTMGHLTQFIDLWARLQDVHLVEDVEDVYECVKSLGPFKDEVICLAPHAKHNLVDGSFAKIRLAKLWPLPPLQANHGIGLPSFRQLSFLDRLWQSIKDWLGITKLKPYQCVGISIENWWNMMTSGAIPNRKVIASLTLLVTWKIWSGRNTRVFHDKHAPHIVIL
jgi:hypothetical protein